MEEKKISPTLLIKRLQNYRDMIIMTKPMEGAVTEGYLLALDHVIDMVRQKEDGL